MKKLKQRLVSPTPRFFKRIRNIGLLLAAISGIVLSAPVTPPTVIVQVAGYLALAGSIASAVSQTAVRGE